MTLTYAELFAGAGGLSMGLEAAGFHAVAHAEIDPHARAVLRHLWPHTRLDGDVSKLNGADYRGVTLISGGSPCQDLSQAGKREGLGGERSGLFYDQVRIWNESGAPYLLWENVCGALSSNNGYDFAAVLSTIVGRDLVADGAIAPDKHGKLKWLRAGRASGPTATVAWRVIDLAEFGLPHRRARVFLVASRAGHVDPAEILGIKQGSERCNPTQRYTQASPRSVKQSDDEASGWYCLIHQRDLFNCGCVVPHYDCSACGEWTSSLHYDREDGCQHCGEEFQETWTPDEIGTITDGAHSGGGTNGQDFYTGRVIVQGGRARRLVPVETERLMGWPDGWTKCGIDENGDQYELPDSARFRLVGNGVGSVCVQWIAERLASEITKHHE